MMFTKGAVSSLVYVTAFDGNQTFTFATGDPMNLNQFGAGLNGTADDLEATAPTGNNAALVSRIRMISYYLDTTIDPTTPRLVRHMNWGPAALPVNQRGMAVAFAIDNLQFSFDMVDGDSNPSNVKMVAADLAGTGRCAPDACSPNQIRKVNLLLAGRSAQPFSLTKRFFRNSLETQVSFEAWRSSTGISEPGTSRRKARRWTARPTTDGGRRPRPGRTGPHGNGAILTTRGWRCCRRCSSWG